MGLCTGAGRVGARYVAQTQAQPYPDCVATTDTAYVPVLPTSSVFLCLSTKNDIIRLLYIHNCLSVLYTNEVPVRYM